MEVCVIKPRSMEDTREITDTLLANCTVVLNMEGLDAAHQAEHRTDGIAQFGGGIEIRGHEAGRLVDTGKALTLALRESTGGNRRAHH